MTALGHAALALALTLLAGLACGQWWAGAMLGAGLFLGREHAQAEYRWIDAFTPDRRRASLPWWGGFDPRVWGKADAWLDWTVPLIACAVLARAAN